MEEFDCDLSDYSNAEIAEEYFERGLDMSEDGIDSFDLELLREIKEKFINSTWAERVEMHKTIMG